MRDKGPLRWSFGFLVNLSTDYIVDNDFLCYNGCIERGGGKTIAIKTRGCFCLGGIAGLILEKLTHRLFV
ncbi:MAG: hypothetical protein A3J93_01260 [Candidatus Magasanikbacteria bacterium RIFOXYC2_FULL_42_28]|uniref:Uncharacterized protein n=1 Tax=Candidatus Magasanikbacteria bacterium RIFOXYC2_FULL_42_28 TaxID=1798704 RepID=A0A1F6NXP3_9BACT|nr:MAG: hypothetical protein A3J93_01260 [Candidatus Magasanikbacteria bacterium RIFOXYC2_FULL_42_28]